MDTWRVGTSGWQYADWRGTFYPERLPARSWLGHYAESFDCTELNSSFYRLPSVEQFQRWRETTPPGFTFAVKASRFLTHVKRLAEPAEPVERLLAAAAGLGPALGPVLLQLPPTLPLELDRLAQVLEQLAGRVAVAVEPRHPSWWVPAVHDLLVHHGAALVWADRDGRLLNPPWVTAGWGFVRLHHGRTRWEYGTVALRHRARRWRGAFDGGWAFCNNDPGGAAVRDARRLQQLLSGAPSSSPPLPAPTPKEDRAGVERGSSGRR